MKRDARRPRFEIYFLVRGSGEFPIDMLRYDSACPATEQDSHAMRREEEKRVVLLRRFTLDKPPTVGNEARWRSFGWEPLAWSEDVEKLADHPEWPRSGSRQ